MAGSTSGRYIARTRIPDGGAEAHQRSAGVATVRTFLGAGGTLACSGGTRACACALTAADRRCLGRHRATPSRLPGADPGRLVEIGFAGAHLPGASPPGPHRGEILAGGC